MLHIFKSLSVWYITLEMLFISTAGLPMNPKDQSAPIMLTLFFNTNSSNPADLERQAENILKRSRLQTPITGHQARQNLDEHIYVHHRDKPRPSTNQRSYESHYPPQLVDNTNNYEHAKIKSHHRFENLFNEKTDDKNYLKVNGDKLFFEQNRNSQNIPDRHSANHQQIIPREHDINDALEEKTIKNTKLIEEFNDQNEVTTLNYDSTTDYTTGTTDYGTTFDGDIELRSGLPAHVSALLG